MDRISPQESGRISELSSRLGNLELRTLLSDTGGTKRLMRPERFNNLTSGRGRISAAERERLALIQTNAPLLEKLSAKGEGKQKSKVNRALRDWITLGKGKGVSYKDQSEDEKREQQRAIRALRFLGVDPSEGTYYVRKRKA